MLLFPEGSAPAAHHLLAVLLLSAPVLLGIIYIWVLLTLFHDIPSAGTGMAGKGYTAGRAYTISVCVYTGDIQGKVQS